MNLFYKNSLVSSPSDETSDVDDGNGFENASDGVGFDGGG